MVCLKFFASYQERGCLLDTVAVLLAETVKQRAFVETLDLSLPLARQINRLLRGMKEFHLLFFPLR
jgi:hypothetical protein